MESTVLVKIFRSSQTTFLILIQMIVVGLGRAVRDLVYSKCLQRRKLNKLNKLLC